MNRRSFFRGVVAAVSVLVGAAYGLRRPRVGPDGLTNEDIDHDLMRRDPSCKGRTYGTGATCSATFSNGHTVTIWRCENGSWDVVGPAHMGVIL